MNYGITIGLLIGIPYNIFKVYMYIKYKKDIKLFNGLSLVAIILGFMYGFKGDKD